MVDKFDDIFNHFDTITDCDRRTDGRTDGRNLQVSIAREHADALQIGCCVTYKPHVVEFMLVYANLGPQYKLPTMQACHCQPTFSVSHAIGHTALERCHVHRKHKFKQFQSQYIYIRFKSASAVLIASWIEFPVDRFQSGGGFWIAVAIAR